MIFLGNVYSQNSWTFPNIPSFLLGQFNSFAMSAPNPLPQQKWFVDAYVQDTWKVTPRLTVNVGVRWEPSLPPGALNQRGLQLQLREHARRSDEQGVCQRASGADFPRRCRVRGSGRRQNGSGICLRRAWRSATTPRVPAR